MKINIKEVIKIARQARKDITSHFSHVMVQGIEKIYIFEKSIYKKKYFELLMKNTEEFNIKIISYVIMDNHAHLCLYYETIENLSKYMHKVNSIFAHYYNYLEKRVGYLFRNRFYVQEIMSRKQLYNVISYIHNNPRKANLVKNLEDYQYSSYKNYLYNNIDKKIISLVFETNEYKEIFHYVHKNYDEIGIIDVQKNDVETIIRKYLNKNKISFEMVKKDKNLSFELIKILYEATNIRNKEIVEIFNIDKNRVTRIKKKILNSK